MIFVITGCRKITIEQEIHICGLLDDATWGFDKDCKFYFGDATGVDSLAHRYAIDKGFSWQRFKADWDRYQSSAGPIRNNEMLSEALMQGPTIAGIHLTKVLAFWDGKSKGTLNCITQATEKGIHVNIYPI